MSERTQEWDVWLPPDGGPTKGEWLPSEEGPHVD